MIILVTIIIVRDLDTGDQSVYVGNRWVAGHDSSPVDITDVFCHHNDDNNNDSDDPRYPVTCLSLSTSGRYLATGETAVMGVRALTSIWDTRWEWYFLL